MPYSTNIIKLLDKLEPATKEVLIAILEEIEVQREATVTKKRIQRTERNRKATGHKYRETNSSTK